MDSVLVTNVAIGVLAAIIALTSILGLRRLNSEITQVVARAAEKDASHDPVTDSAKIIEIEGKIAALGARLEESEGSVKSWFRKINARLDREEQLKTDEDAMLEAGQQQLMEFANGGQPPGGGNPTAGIPYVPPSRMRGA